MEKERVIEYAAIAAALVILAVGIISATSMPGAAKPYTQGQFQQAMDSQLPDKCQTPPGYTDAKWREHMGHHPELYQECL
ncbi:MAG: hypothetical protein HY519_02760 [Candidatus Aenigmarchaeota archaeon]|nr:hypothetical protein [Candidatus Aenigmarchaeota archaeon]